ncbi:MAG: hypothetical protein IJH63_10230 [Methanobrevibacter sp.]|nr:hypothetical protein [Methanosphaera sp.]MBR0371076.1 hypothetical protein [Methanobrevibacter sp.]
MMTKNEIAKNIRRNLKKVFGKTMKFSVRSTFAGSTPSITVTIKEAHSNYFKTLSEYENEIMDLKINNPSLYNSLIKQFKSNRVNALSDEVMECITYLANEFNYDNSDPYTDYYDVGYYLTITDGCRSIKKLSN